MQASTRGMLTGSVSPAHGFRPCWVPYPVVMQTCTSDTGAACSECISGRADMGSSTSTDGEYLPCVSMDPLQNCALYEWLQTGVAPVNNHSSFHVDSVHCTHPRRSHRRQWARREQRLMRRVIEGSASGQMSFTACKSMAKHDCLLVALRELGVSISSSRPGPFWALADGNRFLQSSGCMLIPVLSNSDIVGSSFIVWADSHFTSFQGSYHSLQSQVSSDTMVFALVRRRPRFVSQALRNGSFRKYAMHDRFGGSEPSQPDNTHPEVLERALPFTPPVGKRRRRSTKTPVADVLSDESALRGRPPSCSEEGDVSQSGCVSESGERVRAERSASSGHGAASASGVKAEPNETVLKTQKETNSRRGSARGAASSSDPPRESLENWFASLRKRATEAPVVHPDDPVDETSIVYIKNQAEKVVRDACEGMDPRLQHILVGAVALHVVRAGQLTVYEEVLALHLVEGGTFLRAHNGTAWVYDPCRCWQMYSGVVTTGTLARLRIFMLRLEGFFRSMPAGTIRRESEIIAHGRIALMQSSEQTVQVIFERMEHLSNEAFLAASKAHRRKGKGGKRDASAGGSGVLPGGSDDSPAPGIPPADGGDDVAEIEVPHDTPYHIQIAIALCNLSLRVQSKLLGDRILKIYVEWCETESLSRPGLAFRDTVIAFDEDDVVVKHIPRHSSSNIYFFIARPLLDPVAENARHRVETFYNQTFWRNGLAFKCQFAALSLALRGLNIDRCFWGIGPGGVGQSLFSTHIAALLGGLHAWLDTNIYWSDDELRKQADTLVGCPIVTAQEAVQGAGRTMREDLYKKHISGDPVAARMPYAIQTKLIELTGWKRMELNTFMKFSGVVEDTFDSIMRRGWVMVFRARFADASVLRAQFPDGLPPGVFARDPDLKHFLKSDPACGATLQLLRGFWLHNSKAQCQDIIEHYAARGGDDGVTRKSLRFACGLVEEIPDDVPEGNVQSEGISDDARRESNRLRPEPFDPLGSAIKDSVSLAEQAMLAMLQQGRDTLPCAIAGKQGIRWLDKFNQKNREVEFRRMARRARWHYVEKHGIRKEFFCPHIVYSNPYTSLCKMEPTAQLTPCEETFDLEAIKEYMSAVGRRENIDVMCTWRTALRAMLKPPRGAATAIVQAEMDGLAADINDIREHEVALVNLVRQLEKNAEKPEMCVSNNEKLLVKYITTYKQRYDRRTRRYAEEAGAAQRLSRVMLCVGCPHTEDWDISNCVFTLIPQITDRLNIQTALDVFQLPVTKAISINRADVCESLGMTEAEGKLAFNSLLNGGHPAGHVKDHEVVTGLMRESRALRWLSVSCLPKLYDTFIQEPGRKNPESGLLHYWWTPFEDYCLETWATYVLGFKPIHLSLHFDGIRVDTDVVSKCEDFGRRVVDIIRERTGYTVRVTRKEHVFFWDALCSRASECVPVVAPCELLLRAGNCIPMALCHLMPDRVSEITQAVEAKTQANAAAMIKKLRRYKSWHGVMGITLIPMRGLCLDAGKNILVHFERRGNPHCVAVQRRDSSWHIMDGDAERKISLGDFSSSFEQSIDASVIVTFLLVTDGQEKPQHSSMRKDDAILLDLHAGGRGGKSIMRRPSINRKRPSAKSTLAPKTRKEKPAFPKGSDARGSSGDDQILPLRISLPPLNKGEDELEKELLDQDPGADILGQFKAETLSWTSRLTLTHGGSRPMKSTHGVDHLSSRATDAVRQISVVGGQVRCPLCPCRVFQRSGDVRVHLLKYHDETHRFCPSGVKQMRVALALRDDDLYRGRIHRSYLERSATLLRQCLGRTKLTRMDGFHRVIRLVLDSNGPWFMHSNKVGVEHLRVGTYWVHRRFAAMVFRSAMMEHASLRGIHTRCTYDMIVNGSKLVSLLPHQGSDWWPHFLGFLLETQLVRSLRFSLLRECEQHHEFRSLSLDGTVKTTFKLLGQTVFFASQEERAEQAVRDGDALYSVLTVKGITGAVLCCQPFHRENPVNISDVLLREFTSSQLSMVQHVAVDAPSGALFRELCLVMPNLRLLSLDPTHVVMLYEATQSHKRTEGSTWLRMAMARFSHRSTVSENIAWGEEYEGMAVEADAHELTTSEHILHGSLSLPQANKILEKLKENCDKPWLYRIDFVYALAAISSAYAAETKKISTSGVSLRRSLYNLGKPEKVEFLLNCTRWRHCLGAQVNLHMPSGTTSNEAFHAEVNRWCKTTTALHQATLRIKLALLLLVKLLTHNAALYRPPSVQTWQSVTLARTVSGLSLWTVSEWRALCSAGDSSSQFACDLQAARSSVREWKSVKLKRPAAALKKRPVVSPGRVRSTPKLSTHRTVFRLKRKTRVCF